MWQEICIKTKRKYSRKIVRCLPVKKVQREKKKRAKECKMRKRKPRKQIQQKSEKQKNIPLVFATATVHIRSKNNLKNK